MGENNRKPIEKCRKKLPQFTTMNVIDGQAGLVIYSSLNFYSRTIDNILNIIVLLILAGVSIAMLTGQNGILTQAQRAKTETSNAEEDELRGLTALEAATNLENTTYKDINAQTAPIPAGFAVSKVEGENTIKDGLVVIDSKGNEFVWISVANAGDYKVNESYADTNVSQNTEPDVDYLPDGIKPTDESETEEQAERDAVVKVGGFYISRYETGKEGESTLVSKSGATVWNNQTQEEFKDIAKGFSENTEYVKSALCSGIQWDMAMAFITKNDDSYSVTESTEAWHNGSEPAKSGANPEDKACNIYDLEGNCVEYIAEKNTFKPSYSYVSRGGSYLSNNPASIHNYRYGDGDDDYSFRFVLYAM